MDARLHTKSSREVGCAAAEAINFQGPILARPLKRSHKEHDSSLESIRFTFMPVRCDGREYPCKRGYPTMFGSYT